MRESQRVEGLRSKLSPKETHRVGLGSSNNQGAPFNLGFRVSLGFKGLGFRGSNNQGPSFEGYASTSGNYKFQFGAAKALPPPRAAKVCEL